MALVYHGTPVTPVAALRAVLAGRAACVSYFRPDSTGVVEEIAPYIMFDNGAYSFWKRARRSGRECEEIDRDWRPYYAWLEDRLWLPGRWAVIPDRIAAPSQLNDALISDWPHGRARGAPVWHMDGTIERLARLCDRFDRVCFGWVGEFDPAIADIRVDQRDVGCEAYHRKMDQVSRLFGNRWPLVHQFRGGSVGAMYPFASVDITTLGQNGWRHDWQDRQVDLFTGEVRGEWAGRRMYADRIEARAA